jgi:uncharacterized protein YhjY with autotransporter beta-barrel domain
MKLFLRSILFFAVTGFAPLAFCQTSWTGLAGDNAFENAGNWTDGVPNATTIAVISVNATINQSTTAQSALVLTVNGGTVNLTIGSGDTLTIQGQTPFAAGTTNNTIASGATLNFAGGTLDFVDGQTEVGNASGAGTLNITSGMVNFPTTSDESRLTVGATGTGMVVQSGTSIVNTGAALLIGGSDTTTSSSSATGSGSYTLNNSAQLISPGFVGLGLNTYAGDASTGSLTLNNSSSFAESDELLVGSIEYLAGTPTPQPGVGGGNGIITQNDTSTVDLTGNGAIFGSFNGTSATSLCTGTYDLNGGTLTLNNGLGAGAGTLFGGATNAVGTLNQTSGALIVVAATQLTFGGSSSATLLPGVTGGGVGNYNLSGGSADISGIMVLGDTAGSTGTVNQSGSGTLTAEGTSAVIIGNAGIGIYNLSGGSTDILGSMVLGDTAGSTGTVNQTGGTFTAEGTSTVSIGDAGTGYYDLSGGPGVTADFQNGFDVATTGGTGTVMQSGGTLTAENIVTIGGGGTGIYSLQGGTATFNDGVVVGATGSVNQTGGTFIVPLGQTLDLSAAGSSYTLGGTGILQIGNDGITNGLVGTSGEGTLNFAGGTLQPLIGSAAPLVDGLDGTITGVSTLDTTNANITLNGNMTGSGTLDIIGAGTVTLDNTSGTASSGSWGATITGGSILTATSVNSLSTTGSYSIGSGSTFNLGSTGIGASDTFLGNISDFSDPADPTGTAEFNMTGLGSKLRLAGVTNLSINSATTIGSGDTLEVDQGTISNVNGVSGLVTDTFDVGNGTTTGTVQLLGANNFGSGLVTVNAGSTLLAGSIRGNIINNGTLGTLGTFAAPSSLTLNGNLTSTGTLLINSNGHAIDTFGTAGTPLSSAHLSGTVQVNGVGTVTNVPIVYTTGGVVATIGAAPGDLTTNPPTTLFIPTLSIVGNNLVLSTQQNLLSSYAQTPNEAAAAGSLDTVILSGTLPPAFVPILGAFNQLSASQIPGALEELTPETLQYARIISFENSTYLVERMNGVDADLRGGYGGLDTSALSVITPGFDSSLGRSLGSLLAYNDPAFHSSAPNGVNYYPGEGGASSPSSPSSSTPTWDSSTQVISDSPNPYLATQNPSGPETPGFSEFISGDAVLADLNQDQSAANAPSAKASYTAGDATAGVSFRMSSHLAAGILFDYNHTHAKTDYDGSKTDVDSYSPGLYATYFDKGFYVNGLFAFGYNNYSNTRDISFLGESATSHPNGQQYVGDLDFGYDFHPDKSWILGPTLGITYTHLDIDSFTESGAPGADLAINSQSADSLRTRLGGHVVFQTNTGDVLLQPNLTLMWQHEYLDDGSGITSSFNDFSSNPFTIQTASPSRDSALIGCGLTATLNNSMALYLDYLADVGASDYFAQSVVGGFKARF